MDWKPPSVYDGMHPARIWRLVVSGTCQNIFILFFQEYILNILYSSYFRMMICEIPETHPELDDDPWNFTESESRSGHLLQRVPGHRRSARFPRRERSWSHRANLPHGTWTQWNAMECHRTLGIDRLTSPVKKPLFDGENEDLDFRISKTPSFLDESIWM